MATINFATREIIAKIVYFGSTGSGSNTNVRKLYEIHSAKERSKLHKFGPGGTEERSWFFDYTPAADCGITGFTMRFRVYSLPGGLTLPAHREEVIRHVDGLVFIANAAPGKEKTNLQSLMDLETLLAGVGIELATMPVALQVNHTDAEGARPAKEVVRDLNTYGYPVLPAVAHQGTGVVETHQEICVMIEARVQDGLAGNEGEITLTALHDNATVTDSDIVREHVHAIQDATATPPASAIDELTTQYEQLDLPPGPQVEVGFQPQEFVGSFPVRVLYAKVNDHEVRVDLLMERMTGGTQRRLTVCLANRPTDTPPMPRSTAQPAPPSEDRVFDYLPNPGEAAATSSTDLSPITYGVVGVFGGIVIGLLLGYLLLTL